MSHASGNGYDVALADLWAVTAFGNFLRQAGPPRRPGDGPAPVRSLSPAAWAYLWGLTAWCPAEGEL